VSALIGLECGDLDTAHNFGQSASSFEVHPIEDGPQVVDLSSVFRGTVAQGRDLAGMLFMKFVV
jgi:hypothetical protein